MISSLILSFLMSSSFAANPSRCAITYDYNGNLDDAICSDGTKVDKFLPKRASEDVHSGVVKAMENLGYKLKRSHLREGQGATDYHFVKNEQATQDKLKTKLNP